MNVPARFRIGQGWDVHALVEGRPLTDWLIPKEPLSVMTSVAEPV